MARKTICIVIVMIMLCLCSCGSGEAAPDGSEAVCLVNGETVCRSETDYFSSRCRADIVNEFSSQYGITDFSDFWDTEYDGRTPRRALDELALNKAVEAKLKLVLMRENGIYEDIGYDALLEKAKNYNEEHKDAKNTVGITSIDLSSFYTYYIETGELELKNILAEGALKPTNEEIESAYLDGMTEEGAISEAVNKKYPDYISSLIESAEIIPAD